jgi:hypothetical protein
MGENDSTNIQKEKRELKAPLFHSKAKKNT